MIGVVFINKMYHLIFLLQQEITKEGNKKEDGESVASDEKKNDKVIAAKKDQDNVEADGDAPEPEDGTKKKKKKGTKEDTKEKGNFSYNISLE